MKDLRPALRAILMADPTVSGLVGATRIYPQELPQGQRDPSIVYHRVSEFMDYHMSGQSPLSYSRMQIDAWATRPDLATELSNAAHDRLSGFHGIQDNVEFGGMFAIASREDKDTTTELFRVSRDYNVWYYTV